MRLQEPENKLIQALRLQKGVLIGVKAPRNRRDSYGVTILPFKLYAVFAANICVCMLSSTNSSELSA